MLCVHLQVWNENDEQDECLAMVVRTGLNTSVGKMLRPLVHNKWAQTQSELRTPLGFLRQVICSYPNSAFSPCLTLYKMLLVLDATCAIFHFSTCVFKCL